MATVEIESVHPLDGSLGLPLQTQVSVVFNQLMDETTITSSTFLVSGPDTSNWETPGIRLIDNESPENVLLEFNGEAYLDGTISFTQESIQGAPVTRATFTPTQPLVANTKYVVYLTGDEGLDDAIVPPISAVDSTVLLGTYMWTFTAGSGSVVEVPNVASTAVSVPPSVDSSSTVTAPFALTSSIPDSRATNLDVSTDTIVLNFNRDVDGTTVDSAISIVAESVNGDTSIPAPGNISFTSSTTGKQVTLTMTTALVQNNVVSIMIGSSLSDTAGNPLVASDCSFYFTTTYNPLYVNTRRIRMDIGGFLSGIPDDTINLAIFEASRTADAIAWTGTVTNQTYYDMVKRNFVICEAAGILLQGISMDGGIASKKLGDFSVEYDTGHMPRVLDRLADCVDKWQPLLMSGGNERDFTMAVKGRYDPNRPVIGRVWEKESGSIPGANVKESYYFRWRNTWGSR